MDKDQKARLGGLFLMLSGGLLAYLAIWRPYQSALAGSTTVSLNQTGIALGILFPLMGMVLVAGGEAVSNHLKAHTAGTRTTRGWAYIAIIAAIALGTFLFVERRFEALGYTS